MPGVLILSPHCDDVPLSLGGTLLSGILPTPSVQVIFSLSRYTKDQPCTGSVEVISPLRQAEERKASRIAQYHTHFMSFAEPFARPGFASLDDIFDRNRQTHEDTSWPQVHDAIQSLLAHHEGLFLAPLGCGDHIDHRIVHRSVLQFLQHNDRFAIGFYEDLPYAGLLAESEILAHVSATGDPRLRPVWVSGSIEQKMALIEVYESQLEQDDFDAVSYHWTRNAGERLWLTEAAAEIWNELQTKQLGGGAVA